MGQKKVGSGTPQKVSLSRVSSSVIKHSSLGTFNIQPKWIFCPGFAPCYSMRISDFRHRKNDFDEYYPIWRQPCCGDPKKKRNLCPTQLFFDPPYWTCMVHTLHKSICNMHIVSEIRDTVEFRLAFISNYAITAIMRVHANLFSCAPVCDSCVYFAPCSDTHRIRRSAQQNWSQYQYAGCRCSYAYHSQHHQIFAPHLFNIPYRHICLNHGRPTTAKTAPCFKRTYFPYYLPVFTFLSIPPIICNGFAYRIFIRPLRLCAVRVRAVMVH